MAATIVAFVVVLGVLIFVHELGHFLTAKRAGLKVEEFGFGFPPRLISFKRGETRYSLNWIPFGGFVKILGEGGEAEKDPRSFAGQRVWVRAKVVGAGIAMNFLLAWVLLSIVNAAGVSTAIEEGVALSPRARVSESVVTITQVVADSPAAQADVRPGDQIQTVGGKPVADQEAVVEAVGGSAGKETTLSLVRGDQALEVTVTPRAEPPEGQGPLGIGLVNTATVSYPWYQAIWEGAKQTIFMTGQIFIVFAGILKQLFTTGSVGADIAGPIGIAVITGQVLDLGIVPLMQFAALLSINLGIVNALPFPALDGGRLLFLLIEKIRRRKVSKRIENAVHSVGFGLLLILIVAITARDFIRFNIIEKIQELF
jgi:regulator of sigma E protease